MNLPNKLTLLRIILVPFFVAFLLNDNIPFHCLIALAIFVAASITDLLDGKIARKRNMVTDFGKFADPLADKILVISAFACFLQMNIVNAVFLIIVLFREFAVTSIRLVAAENGKVVAANMWGKSKTVMQMTAVIAVMVFGVVFEIFDLKLFYIPEDIYNTIKMVTSIAGQILLWISAVLTVISGWIYIKDNFDLIKNAK